MAATLGYSCHGLEEDQITNVIIKKRIHTKQRKHSLCDLPTHCDSANSDYFSKEYQSSSYDQDEDTFFEFSEEFTSSTYPSGNKDIIFCGKLFPHNKEAPHEVAAEKKTQRSTETNNKSCTKKKWRFFRWRRFRRSKPKIVSHSLKRAQVKDSKSTSTATKTISELRDIKARQSRRMPSTMFGATSEASKNELRGKGTSKKHVRILAVIVVNQRGCGDY